MSSELSDPGSHSPSCRALLAEAPTARDRPARAALAERLAEALLRDAEGQADARDRARARKLSRLLGDPMGQLFTTTLTDRVFRARSSARTAEQVQHLVRRLGVPRFLTPVERVQLSLAANLARPAAPAVARGVLAQVERESRDLVLDQESGSLARALAERRAQGIGINLNQLGEALLGEREAETRVARYVALARRDDVDALSVKVSSLGSWLSPLAFEADRARVSERLAAIYRASTRDAGRRGPTVMLDMESYDDVALTLAVLESALCDCPDVHAGVVLQAYLPDAHRHLTRVLALARARFERGLPALRVWLVKGANLAFERVEAARRGLALPVFPDKVATDASYKLLLERLIRDGAGAGVALGIASHNVFDLAYALVLRETSPARAAIGLEMLEGMAMPLLRALLALDVPVLTYVPVCANSEMVNGIAYLVRRLDENTSPDNFLRRSFAMRVGDAAFTLERTRFRAAVRAMDTLELRSPRASALLNARPPHARGEPDSDFAEADVRACVAEALDAQRARAPDVLTSEAALPLSAPAAIVDGFDPSRPEVVPYRVALLAERDLDSVLGPLHADVRGYARSTLPDRSALLGRVAQALRDGRNSLIAAMVMDAGKRVLEADAEVSEAIDFAEYYRRSFTTLAAHSPVQFEARGVVLVAPPWNFPLGIPAGSVFAALMAGNRVVLKPALETVLVAQLFVSLAYRAGVPRDVLSLVLCDDEVASAFVRDRRIASVVLTGATGTARLLQRLRPGLHLAAETGGKNAYIVSAMSDHEQAIRDVVASAFGHAGQKCSATSLLILEAELHDDPHFMATLADAVRSLKVGSAYAPDSFVTPLIAPPSGPLARALGELAGEERWLVEPRRDPHNPRLLSPGVKLGITPQSFDYTNELFGPVLGVMRAQSLEHALTLANGTPYGLTAGLASLDEREQAAFVAGMRAGNLYVNRPTTGAIVERQPFGGYDDSSFGSGAKAGGPNYVARLSRWLDGPAAPSPAPPGWLAARVTLLGEPLSPDERALLAARAASYFSADTLHFSRVHDPHGVLGQHNAFRYRARPGALIRVAGDARPVDVLSTVLAAETAEAGVVLSFDPAYRGDVDASLLGYPVYAESAEALCARARGRQYVRMVGSREPALDQLASELGAHLADEPVVSDGRLELLHYVEEQSVSVEAHRHGYLGPAAQRSAVQPLEVGVRAGGVIGDVEHGEDLGHLFADHGLDALLHRGIGVAAALAAAAELDVGRAVTDVEQAHVAAVRGHAGIDAVFDHAMHTLGHGVAQQRRLVGVVELEAGAEAGVDVVEQGAAQVVGRFGVEVEEHVVRGEDFVRLLALAAIAELELILEAGWAALGNAETHGLVDHRFLLEDALDLIRGGGRLRERPTIP